MASSASSSRAAPKIKLRSSDGVAYEVDTVVALESTTIKNQLLADEAEGVVEHVGGRPPLEIRLPSRFLGKAIEFCEKQADWQAKSSGTNFLFANVDFELWITTFIPNKFDELVGFLWAAKHLNIGRMIEVCSARLQVDMDKRTKRKKSHNAEEEEEEEDGDDGRAKEVPRTKKSRFARGDNELIR